MPWGQAVRADVFSDDFASNAQRAPVTISLLRKLCEGSTVGSSVLLGDKALLLSRCARGRAGAMRPAVSRALELGTLALLAAPGCAVLAPSPDAARAGAAAAAGGEVSVAAPARRAVPGAASVRGLAPLPLELGAFCVDAYAEVRTYGEGAELPLERACEQVLGPGCRDELGLERVTAVRYVEAEGGRASLDVIVRRFADADAAYTSFSARLLGERDPLELTARPFDAPGVGVLDGERAAGWRGRFVVALEYRDETQPARQRTAAASARLPESARRLLATLPSDSALPLAVQKLPRAHRLPLGTRLLAGNALGIAGMGTGAIGHYRDGDKRWRVLAIVRQDAESASDVLSTLRRSPAARKIRNAPLGAVSVSERRLPAEPSVTWVFGQRQEVIYGVGDDATALPEHLPAEREAAVKLGLLDKLAKLTRTHLE